MHFINGYVYDTANLDSACDGGEAEELRGRKRNSSSIAMGSAQPMQKQFRGISNTFQQFRHDHMDTDQGEQERKGKANVSTATGDKQSYSIDEVLNAIDGPNDASGAKQLKLIYELDQLPGSSSRLGTGMTMAPQTHSGANLVDDEMNGSFRQAATGGRSSVSTFTMKEGTGAAPLAGYDPRMPNLVPNCPRRMERKSKACCCCDSHGRPPKLGFYVDKDDVSNDTIMI